MAEPALRIYQTFPDQPVNSAAARANGVLVPSVGPGGRALGVQQITQFSLQPTLAESWEILGWSFSARLWALTYVYNAGIAGGPLYALPGALYGGVALDAQATGSGPNPWETFNGLPQDSSNIAEVWDGQTPELPSGSQNVSTPQGVVVQSSQNLASPITIASGQRLFGGWWMTPGLLYNTYVVIANAQMSVVYNRVGS